MPTTSGRRLVSLFTRSGGFVDQICRQFGYGNSANESESVRAFQSIFAIFGGDRGSMRATSLGTFASTFGMKQ